MNTKEWHADIPITEALAKKCLETQFPALSPISEITLIGEGWDNRVFLVDQQIVFRFPRRKVAVDLLQQENRALNNLPRFSEIAIPLPKYVGQPTTDYPYPFQGYSLISGVAAYQADLSDAERKTSIPIMASFLKQLHAVDPAQAATMGVGSQFFDRSVIERTIETLQNRVARINAQKIIAINLLIFDVEIARIENLTLLDTDRCLVHGDLDCRHLIFDQQELKGIIDWGDMGINNKAVDLSLIWSFYPSECHALFFKLYGPVSSSTWQYARFLGLYSAFTLMLYAADINDALLLAESVKAIIRINAALIDV